MWSNNLTILTTTPHIIMRIFLLLFNNNLKVQPASFIHHCIHFMILDVQKKDMAGIWSIIFQEKRYCLLMPYYNVKARNAKSVTITYIKENYMKDPSFSRSNMLPIKI